MAGLSNIGFVLIVFGEMSFSMKLREMEKHYEKNVKEQIIKQYQPEASTPLSYENEFSLKNKDVMYREIYQSIDFFDEIIREALIELKEKVQGRNEKAS